MTAHDRLQELARESGCIKPNRPYLVGWDREVEAFYVFRPDCKCWNCPPCASRLQNRWTKRIFEGIEIYINAGEHFTFVTLTSHERLVTFNQTLQVWPKAWGKLRDRVARKAPGWHFVLVPEQHRTGRLHVHLIANANLGTRWWKDKGRECGLGYIAEEAEFRSGEANPARAASYVSKYLKKQMAVKAWPRYFHHVRTSQDFPELPEREQNPYAGINWVALTPKQLLSWLADRERQNDSVFYTGTGEKIT